MGDLTKQLDALRANVRLLAEAANLMNQHVIAFNTVIQTTGPLLQKIADLTLSIATSAGVQELNSLDREMRYREKNK